MPRAVKGASGPSIPITSRNASRPRRAGTKELNFPPISRKAGLQLTELRGKEIFEVASVLTLEECESFIEAAEKLGFEVQGSRGPAFGEAVRRNDRIAIQSTSLAESIWINCGLSEIFRDVKVDSRKACGLNPNIRFYRYEAGHKFGKHIDESNQVGDAWTHYTLLIYLSGLGYSSRQRNSMTSKASSPISGGETLFYGGKRSKLIAHVVPQAGLALLHIHGPDCHEHEGAVVLSGIKYVLRSDVLFR